MVVVAEEQDDGVELTILDASNGGLSCSDGLSTLTSAA